MLAKIPRKSCILLTLALCCQANRAGAQQPDLSKLDLLPPAEKKQWDTPTPWPFHSEMGSREGAGIGSVFHGPQGSALGYRRGYRSFSDLLPAKNAITPYTDNQETQWQQLERALAPATAKQRDNITIKTTQLFRYIGFNGLPDFSMDVLPLIANPGAAKSQAYTVRMTLTPEYRYTPAGLLRIARIPFGIALNGVLIIRGNNDYWKIHNHGISKNILWNLRQNKQPTLIGYAADGYPIYGPFGYKQADNSKSALVELKTSFRVKGSTTTENKDASGSHRAGTSNNSATTASSAPCPESETKETKPLLKYEYIDKLGDLDDYNGRFGVTTEYPEGTYYYVISNSFPYIPVSFRGVPDQTFIPPEWESSAESTSNKLRRFFPTSSPPYHKLFNPSPPSSDF
jgi:hypothetical protein